MSLIILTNNAIYEENKQSIHLQSSVGNNIPNYQTKELSQFEINTFDFYPKKYPFIQFKGQPTPIYNCHGFTFASKRTNIYTRDIRSILREDSYIQIARDNILPGDIVLYVANDGSGDIPHTGMLIQIDKTIKPEILYILGKWGKYKEVIHPALVCEYDNCNLEFWRNNHGFVKAE